MTNLILKIKKKYNLNIGIRLQKYCINIYNVYENIYNRVLRG